MIFYIILFILAFLLFLTINRGITGHATGSPPTFTEIMNTRNQLTTEFDTLKTTLNQKKKDYQACITDLIRLSSDTDASEDPIHQKKIIDKNMECYDSYNYLVGNAGDEVGVLCGGLEFRYRTLMDENAESIRYQQEQALSREGLTYDDLIGNDALRERIFADVKSQDDFATNMLKEEQDILTFCHNIKQVLDPCIAVSSGRIENTQSNSLNPDTEAQVIIDNSNPAFVSDNSPSSKDISNAENEEDNLGSENSPSSDSRSKSSVSSPSAFNSFSSTNNDEELAPAFKSIEETLSEISADNEEVLPFFDSINNFLGSFSVNSESKKSEKSKDKVDGKIVKLNDNSNGEENKVVNGETYNNAGEFFSDLRDAIEELLSNLAK